MDLESALRGTDSMRDVGTEGGGWSYSELVETTLAESLGRDKASTG